MDHLHDAEKRLSVSNDFVEPEEPFVDDELQLEKDAIDWGGDRSNGVELNFLERDNFEIELGSSALDHSMQTGDLGADSEILAPSQDEFESVSKYNILDVSGTDTAGRIIIVFYAYRLPDNRTFDYEMFLRYSTSTLDKYVEQDYTIVYFHYGLRSFNKPSTKWLIGAYKLLDRKYKKNLKALYLVHPTRFIRFMWLVFKPFISAKFERKLSYVNYVHELRQLLQYDNFLVPVEIENHDALLRSGNKITEKSTNIGGSVYTNSNTSRSSPSRQFRVTLNFILKNHPNSSNLPPIVVQLVEYLEKEGIMTEGIFRRSIAVSDLEILRRKVDAGESIDLDQLTNPHAAAALLKAFLRDLPEPLLTYELFSDLLKVQDARNNEEAIRSIKSIIDRLPPENYALLAYLVKFLNKVMAHSDVNLMNATNLATVFGPNLARAGDAPTSLSQLQNVNNFTYRLLTNSAKIFT